MPKKANKKGFFSPIKVIAGAGAIILFVAGQLVSDRAIGWGNEMINQFISENHDNVLAWILHNPFNLMQALALLIIVLISIDAYFYQKNKLEPKRSKSRGENQKAKQTDGKNTETLKSKRTELAYQIGVEIQKFYDKFKAARYMQLKNKLNSCSEALESIKAISTEFFPRANIVLKNTSIPELIGDIHTQMTNYHIQVSTLSFCDEERMGFIKGRMPVPRDVVDRINQAAFTLEKLDAEIESSVNQLIDLSRKYSL